MNRRRFLESSALAAFSLWIEPGRIVRSRPRFGDDPFTLGVASGDATEQSVVLWTRLATRPIEPDGGMSPEPVRVRWQLAEDEGMGAVIREGEVSALPELAHSVHVEVQGLRPGREYWYRFVSGQEESEIARTKTLPPSRGPVDRLTFVTASCQHYEPGYFVAYRQMIEDDPDFVLHLGDYIYDVSFGDDFRKHETEKVPETLDEFRLRHALYKSDEYLRAAHARIPFVAVPDNHDALEFNDPAQLRRRAAAYQAWYEHLPIRAWYRRGSASLAIYRAIDIGELARLYVLDTRQFRDEQELCSEGVDPSFAFGIYRKKCAELDASNRSMLGEEQEQWLFERMRSSASSWNVIATTVPFVPFEFHRGGDRYVYHRSWNGYTANRERILDNIQALALRNPVFVSGDVHSSWVSDIEVPFGGRRQTVATEFTTTSISAGWPPALADPVSKNLVHNPQVRLYEPTRRGYCLHRVEATRWTTRMKTLSSVTSREPDIIELGPFVVEGGRPGARQE